MQNNEGISQDDVIELSSLIKAKRGMNALKEITINSTEFDICFIKNGLSWFGDGLILNFSQHNYLISNNHTVQQKDCQLLIKTGEDLSSVLLFASFVALSIIPDNVVDIIDNYLVFNSFCDISLRSVKLDSTGNNQINLDQSKLDKYQNVGVLDLNKTERLSISSPIYKSCKLPLLGKTIKLDFSKFSKEDHLAICYELSNMKFIKFAKTLGPKMQASFTFECENEDIFEILQSLKCLNVTYLYIRESHYTEKVINQNNDYSIRVASQIEACMKEWPNLSEIRLSKTDKKYNRNHTEITYMTHGKIKSVIDYISGTINMAEIETSLEDKISLHKQL